MKITSSLAVTIVMILVCGGCVWAEPAGENYHWPTATIIHDFPPPGESNVRSSFKLAEGVALIGTEETADIYKTEDAGQTWRKTIDGYELWDINDVRYFIRAKDGRLYATTTEPALVIRSADEGETWEVVAKAPASRTVALTELHDGTLLVGLRRSENNKISILRSEDGFKTFDWIPLSDTLPRQNVTCLIEISEGVVLAGVGYEGSGKIFKSTDAGKTWRQTAEFPHARDLMSFFKEGDRVYVTASGIATLYASDDGGETWNTAFQAWEKGFLGESATFTRRGKTYRVLSATDQRQKPYRHVLLISADGGRSWREWIELAKDDTGGCSNVTVISNDRLTAGTGNHSAQAHVYTIEFR
ncbi:MAG: hypothetical protein Kow00105_17090 [Phycisphaeraceae bacterium]